MCIVTSVRDVSSHRDVTVTRVSPANCLATSVDGHKAKVGTVLPQHCYR